MKKIVYIAILTLLLTSCATQKEPVNFEKIIFHSSACFGSCPIYKLQINKDKSLLLYKEENHYPVLVNQKGEIEEKKGFYKGTVNDEAYNLLLIELAKTDTLNLEGQNCCDAPMKTVIAYYNGKRKYFQTMFPSKKAEKLLSLLYKICESDNLIRSDKKFKIEEVNPEQ